MRLRVLARLVQIQRVLLEHGLEDFVRATHLYRPLRFLFYLSPDVWFERRRRADRGERLRLALQELGPIFVKFGQAVSTRRDLLPQDIADELAKLQDRVPPFSGRVARAAHRSAPTAARRRGVRRVRRDSRWPRPRSRRCTPAELQRRHRSRGQGAAPGHARGDRARSRGAVRARRPRAALLGGRPAPAAARGRRRVREDHPRRARPHARGGQRRAAAAQLRRLADCCTCPRSTGTTAAST